MHIGPLAGAATWVVKTISGGKTIVSGVSSVKVEDGFLIMNGTCLSDGRTNQIAIFNSHEWVLALNVEQIANDQE